MRLFFALPLPESARLGIYSALGPCRKGFPELKWTAAEGYHVTLLFLGECSPEESGELIRLCSETAALQSDFRPFTLSWKGIGVFPAKGPGRVFHLPVIQGADEAARIRRALMDRIGRGFGDGGGKNRFKPHITVARLRKGGRPVGPGELGAACADVRGDAPAERVVLYRSRLEPEGPHYEELASLAFGRNDDLEKG